MTTESTHMKTVQSATSEPKNAYLVKTKTGTKLVEANDLRDLKKHILKSEGFLDADAYLESIGFTSKIASGPEVMEFYKNGGKSEATP